MKRLFILLSFISIITICGIFLFSQINAPISTRIFEVKNGFGYIIASQYKVLIKQENIPAIQKNKPFCSKRDAQKTADLVKHKFLKKKTPTVSLDELKSLQIDLNCVVLQ